MCFRHSCPWEMCELIVHNCWYWFPSVLWRCWLADRKGIRPVKNWVVGCWRGYQYGARCRLAAQLMPLLLTVSCFSEIQIGFTFLVLAHPDSPGKRAVKRLSVCWYWLIYSSGCFELCSHFRLICCCSGMFVFVVTLLRSYILWFQNSCWWHCLLLEVHIRL